LNVELLIACLCNHNQFTSIRLSSGGARRTDRNTNFIRGQHLDISFCTLFDLCTDRLSSTTKIFGYFYHYIFYLFFL
jgi:hypothetical protein